jgi:putative DNA primase/helicase
MSKDAIIELAKQMGIELVDKPASPRNANPATWCQLSINDKTDTPHKTVDNVAIILETDPVYDSLSWNEHSDKILWKNERLSDKHIMQIRRDIEVRYMLSRPKKEIDDAVMMVAMSKPIEPIKDYLLSLKWDGKPRLHRLLIDAFSAEVFDSTEDLICGMSFNWFVSAVARILNPGCKADSCLILVGGKGMGKSTSMRVLASEQYFSDSFIDIVGKGGYELLHQTGAWIWELAEMHSLHGKSANAAKQFLSSPVDVYRPSYARHPVERKRRTIFCATTNDYQFLTDGAERRFYPIKITKPIDIDYLTTHRDQIWAEAVHYYQQPDSCWWFDDNTNLSHYQKAFIVQDPWAIRVIQCIEKSTIKCTTADIMIDLELPISQQHSGNSRRIAQICRDCGYEQTVVKGTTYWSKKQ